VKVLSHVEELRTGILCIWCDKNSSDINKYFLFLMHHQDDFDNVEEVGEDVFQNRNYPPKRRDPEEWKNKLGLSIDKTMIDRKVEIGEIQLKNDG
jgi:hypothetical protein